MDMRIVEVFKGDKWIEIEFDKLDIDDRFRLFEQDGERVVNSKGQSEWIASSVPFIGKYGDLTINVYSG